MLKNRSIILMTLLAILLGGVVAANIQAASDTTGAAALGWGRNLRRLAQALDLTAEQQAQMKQKLLAEKDTLHRLLQALESARVGERRAIQAPDASESSVRAAAASLAAAEADLAVERMKLFSSLAPLLTPAQREKLTTLEQLADAKVDNAIAQFGAAPVN